MERQDEWREMFGGPAAGQTQLLNIPLDVLDPWRDANGKAQPFREYTPAQLTELAENIRQNGVITPIRVRPRNSRYQIIAGHNRVTASRMAGLTTVPAIVEDLDDEQAAIVLVDSNLQQREKILPSERAFGYKLKMDALTKQRQIGRPKNQPAESIDEENGAHSVPHFQGMKSRDIVAEQSGESRESVRRYLRLTHLVPPLLERVDTGKLGMTPAVELSSLPQEVQTQLSQILADSKARVSKGAACQLRAEADELTAERIRTILGLNGSEGIKKPLLKLDLSSFDSGQLARLQADAGLEAWLLEQLKRRLSQGEES